MARSDMSDLEWEFIKRVLPNKPRGIKRVDDRRVINGIFYVLRTGIPWADLPSEYGPPTTIYNRFNRWSYAGHYLHAYCTVPEARTAIGKYLTFYNSKRPHSSLDGQTPDQVYFNPLQPIPVAA